MDVPVLKKRLARGDAEALGLTCGLEIHQQLEGRKLFCNCPTVLRDDEPDFTVKRYLRAAAGESGIVDAAALAEMRKRKHNLYEGYRDTTCLVELDEEPPGPVNPEALRAALQVAKVLGMSFVDEARFMRKTVVDGSNTSGFQRTGLLAVGGSLTTESGLRVGVESVCLEEDAAKKVSSSAEAEVYNLSRLGIPLIEIATAPDIHALQGAYDVAEHIGMVLRSLDNVKRGLGTIRQDVNVSIKEGVRVEIKGAQDLKLLPTIVEYEALRQHNLLQVFAALKKRKAKVGSVADVTTLFKGSSSKVIVSALKKGGVVLALPLQGFGGLTGLEVQPSRRYGSELSDYAKVMGVRGLFHADELPNYGITQAEKDAVFKKLKLDPAKDNFLLIADEKRVAERAMAAAAERAADFSLRKEVRQALPDGTSAYMRPMPGAARMYPETDVKPVVVDAKGIVAPKLLSERIGELAKRFGLAKDIVKRLLRDGVDLEALAERYKGLKPSFIVDFFYSTPGVVKKKHNLEVDMASYADELLPRLDTGEIPKDAIVDIVVALAKGGKVDYGKFKALDVSVIDKVVKDAMKADPSAPVGALMGAVMKKLGGKADGKLVMERLRALKK